jgi:hypothetical protein
LGHIRCKTCHHPERGRIELLHVGGASLDSLSKRFGLARDNIWRHMTKHVSDQTRAQLIAGPLQLAQLAERAMAEDLSLLDYLSIIRSTLMDLFQHAAQAKDKNGASITSGRLLQCLDQIGKLTGEIQRISTSSTVINNNTLVLGSPAFARVQAAIISALTKHPEAKADVIAALHAIDDEVPPRANGKAMIEAQFEEVAT